MALPYGIKTQKWRGALLRRLLHRKRDPTGRYCLKERCPRKRVHHGDQKADKRALAGSQDHFPPGAVKALRSSGLRTSQKARSGRKLLFLETGLVIKERDVSWQNCNK